MGTGGSAWTPATPAPVLPPATGHVMLPTPLQELCPLNFDVTLTSRIVLVMGQVSPSGVGGVKTPL